ncbi:MAG: hypothetical protein P8012_05535 [Desulfobacterales bacterium]
MKSFGKKVFILGSCIALMMGFGCAPTLVSFSAPKIQTAGNSYYSAQFEPISEGKNFFDTFRLRITNKTSNDLQIDWNKTRYLHNGRDLGIFVFRGVQPKDIRNLTIPPEIIPAGHSFSKEISPLKLLAREPITGKGADAGKITSGSIPNGENGILLFIRQNDTPIKEKMTVKITEKEIQR